MMQSAPVVEPERKVDETHPDFDPEANDGRLLFQVASNVHNELRTLSPFDVAGGSRTLSNKMMDLGKENLNQGTDAIKKLDWQHGWSGFRETAELQELIKAPIGVGQLLMASVFFFLYALIFYPAKYGPGLLQQANERILTPASRTLSPLVAQGRERLRTTLQQDPAAATASGASSTPP
jgi:hypothetical protein